MIEMVGPYGFTSVLTNAGRSVGSYDTVVITIYALYIILGLISFIFLLFAPVLLQNGAIDSAFGGDLGLILVYLSALVLLPTAKAVSSSSS